MARKKKKEKNIIVRILWRIFGAALIVFPLYAFLSCIFCHIGDNSFLSASAAPVKNLLGSSGANTAAFIFNYFGIALFPFLCAIMVWGWQLVRAKELEFPVYRTFSLLFGILGFSMFLSLLPDFTGTFRLGGTVGALFAGHILTIFKKFYVYGYADWIFGTVLLLFTVFFFNFAAGITCRNWLDFGRRLAGWIKTGALWTAAAFRYIFSFAPHRREEKLKETAKEKTPRRKKEKTAKDKEEKKEPGFEKSKPYVPEPAVNLISRFFFFFLFRGRGQSAAFPRRRFLFSPPRERIFFTFILFSFLFFSLWRFCVRNRGFCCRNPGFCYRNRVFGYAFAGPGGFRLQKPVFFYPRFVALCRFPIAPLDAG